ncbi:hypothetical protein CUZ93_0481 [Enterococcus xinjiangensis]|nr:hypothetical protein [Enterococcus lactis]
MFFDKNLLYLPTWQPSIQVLYLIYFIVKNMILILLLLF